MPAARSGRNGTRRFRGSTSEWQAGYALAFFILFIVAAIESEFVIALWVLGLTFIAVLLSIYSWKRNRSD